MVVVVADVVQAAWTRESLPKQLHGGKRKEFTVWFKKHRARMLRHAPGEEGAFRRLAAPDSGSGCPPFVREWRASGCQAAPPAGKEWAGKGHDGSRGRLPLPQLGLQGRGSKRTRAGHHASRAGQGQHAVAPAHPSQEPGQGELEAGRRRGHIALAQKCWGDCRWERRSARRWTRRIRCPWRCSGPSFVLSRRFKGPDVQKRSRGLFCSSIVSGLFSSTACSLP